MVENSNQYGNPEIGLFFTIKLLLRWALWPNGPLFDRHCKYFVDSAWVFAPVFMMLFFDNVVPFFFTSTKSNATAEYFVIAKKPTRSAFDNWFQIWIHVQCILWVQRVSCLLIMIIVHMEKKWRKCWALVIYIQS